MAQQTAVRLGGGLGQSPYPRNIHVAGQQYIEESAVSTGSVVSRGHQGRHVAVEMIDAGHPRRQRAAEAERFEMGALHGPGARLLATLEQTATGRVLIFTRTKYRARNLARDLEKRRYRAAALQGNMSQNKRQQAIDGFRGGRYDILVATDIAARGIDVSDISHVINFDMPDTVDAYTHRIGRTGRAGEKGHAISFVSREEERSLANIERLIGSRIKRV